MDLPPPPPAGPPPGGALPPPPPTPSAWAEGSGAAGAPFHDAPDGSFAGRLTGAWRWTLGLGWCVVLGGLGALAQAAYLVDADPWWLAVKPLPFALPVAVLLALVSDGRWALPLSATGAAVIGVLAVVDAVRGNPVVAIGEAVCAASGAVLTLAAALGRVRRPAPPVPGSVP